MKKIVALSLALVLVLSLLAGCGTTPSSSPSTSPEVSATAAPSPTASPTPSTTPAAAGVEISLLNSKPEITDALNKIVAQYKQETGVSITVYETDKPGDYLTTAYASGDPTTLAIVDYGNVRDFSKDYFLDLSGEKWAADGGKAMGASFNGALYGFPLTVEARGLIYNKTAIEKVLGKTFNPADYASRDAFASLLADLRTGGMQNGIVLNSDDWSIGSHFLQTMYSLYDGTMSGGYSFTSQLTKGTLHIADSSAFNEAFDTLDLLIKYNYNQADPLAADYSTNASKCADGTVAFWLNATCAWPDFSPFVTSSTEYGIMPLPVSDSSAGYGKVSAAATKFIVVDKSHSTPEQQAAALAFLNWLVYTAEGQDAMVNQCGLMPAFTNITLKPNNPFNISLQSYITAGKTICVFNDLPSDHRSSLGGEMQKYLAGQINRADLAAELDAYWQSK